MTSLPLIVRAPVCIALVACGLSLLRPQSARGDLLLGAAALDGFLTAASGTAGESAAMPRSLMLPLHIETRPHESPGALAAPAEVRELPAAPGSAGLFLSAVLGIGAWHALRNVKHASGRALPEWYSFAGPERIGHAVRLEVSCDSFPVFGGGLRPFDRACNWVAATPAQRSLRVACNSPPGAGPRGPPAEPRA